MYALQQDQDQAHESIQLREKDAKRREAYAVTSRLAGYALQRTIILYRQNCIAIKTTCGNPQMAFLRCLWPFFFLIYGLLHYCATDRKIGRQACLPSRSQITQDPA
jgi:hypothetical protein